MAAPFPTDRAFVVGMLHAPPLLGSPRYGGDVDAIDRHVLADAAALCAPGGAGGGPGVDALMIENFGDVPFFKDGVPAETVAALTRLALRVRDAHPSVPLGVNVLRNDAASALAVAYAVGASAVRVNVLSGATATDQGVIEGRAASVMRRRAALSGGAASGVQVWADVDVKHGAALVARPLDEQVEELLERAGADAVIVSGTGTGKAVDDATLRAVVGAARGKPVLIGSGATAASAAGLIAAGAAGLIVGSAFKPGGRTDAPIDAARVAAVMAAVRDGAG